MGTFKLLSVDELEQGLKSWSRLILGCQERIICIPLHEFHMMINLYDKAKLRVSILCKVDTNYFYKAVQMNLALGFLEVEIEGDVLTVVKKLHAIREDKYEINVYVRNLISLSESYQSCFFGYAPKQGNRVAYLLAIGSIKRGVSTYLTQGVPLSIAIAVEND
ncbi:hypothetical protein CXB51_028060 [Gossypium anomalum]|uniref:RNase H type-1 domain-containing protein n=1 Tax=Gossypium anomalum TaxID=47600 RepID=A0A8J6CKH5_9ROSI|nr:hypothetical protein CXB51_028060 [Gossypium anomalum]